MCMVIQFLRCAYRLFIGALAVVPVYPLAWLGACSLDWWTCWTGRQRVTAVRLRALSLASVLIFVLISVLISVLAVALSA